MKLGAVLNQNRTLGQTHEHRCVSRSSYRDTSVDLLKRRSGHEAIGIRPLCTGTAIPCLLRDQHCHVNEARVTASTFNRRRIRFARLASTFTKRDRRTLSQANPRSAPLATAVTWLQSYLSVHDLDLGRVGPVPWLD
jgi:hypothetical protein